MANWGTRNFENDVAQDWIFDLMDNKDAGLVADTLTRILNNSETLEMSDCEEALAAAEVVSALGGHPSEDFPEDPLDQIDTLALTATPELKEVATGAVMRIIEAS